MINYREDKAMACLLPPPPPPPPKKKKKGGGGEMYIDLMIILVCFISLV